MFLKQEKPETNDYESRIQIGSIGKKCVCFLYLFIRVNCLYSAHYASCPITGSGGVAGTRMVRQTKKKGCQLIIKCCLLFFRTFFSRFSLFFLLFFSFIFFCLSVLPITSHFFRIIYFLVPFPLWNRRSKQVNNKQLIAVEQLEIG